MIPTLAHSANTTNREYDPFSAPPPANSWNNSYQNRNEMVPVNTQNQSNQWVVDKQRLNDSSHNTEPPPTHVAQSVHNANGAVPFGLSPQMHQGIPQHHQQYLVSQSQSHTQPQTQNPQSNMHMQTAPSALVANNNNNTQSTPFDVFASNSQIDSSAGVDVSDALDFIVFDQNEQSEQVITTTAPCDVPTFEERSNPPLSFPKPIEVTQVPPLDPLSSIPALSKADANHAAYKDSEDTVESIEKRKVLISQTLANHAPSTASPLPNPANIHSSGYILTRISFRTLLFKSWKQSFWIRHGPTSLVLFRNREQFEDWKLNPFHTQKERDYLVRLKIDFCGDLINISGCRGYKITSVKRKAYGRRTSDLLLHFKLERHMDYGATIAACFGSQNVAEVESLRRSVLVCIKNARSAASSMIVTAQEDPSE